MLNFFDPIWKNQCHTWKNKVTPILDATSPLDPQMDEDSAQKEVNQTNGLIVEDTSETTDQDRHKDIDKKRFKCPFYSEKGVFSGYIHPNEFGDRLLTTVTMAVAGLQFTADCLLKALINVIESVRSFLHLDIGEAVDELSNAAQNLILAVAAAIHTIAVTAWQFAATFIKLIPSAFVTAGQLAARITSFCRPQAGSEEVINEKWGGAENYC